MRVSLFLASGAAAASTLNVHRDTDSVHTELSFKAKCRALASRINLPDVAVHSVTYVPVGANISMADNPSVCGSGEAGAIDSPFEFCRIALNVTTSARSQVFMEAWLPSNYSGRFLSTGNGGLGGCVGYSDMIYATQYGFATVGTNNGHFGDTGAYFNNNTDVLEDFAFRALHTGVVVGKKITRLFYAKGYKKSYYLGCSTGGRQGWKSVQTFPGDFDGVVAGAPAFNFINLANWGARFLPTTGNSTADTFITNAQWNTIHSEILRQCDDLDGAADGIIEDPDLCQPIFETLLCSSTRDRNSSSCLTAAQVESANTIFSPLYGLNGSLLYPRMQPGSELSAASIYYTGQPFAYAQDWFRYVVYSNPEWNPATWTLTDAEVAISQDPFEISTFNGDLSAFQRKGGKVLHYHGLEDGIISSDSSKVYYKHVARTMGLSPRDLDEFYRFFPISGMGHCAPGNGAGSIGQSQRTFVNSNPEDNILLAMVQWVEDGIAPEFVRGSKVNGTKVEYRRRHCKYPNRNRYVGPGSYGDESAWMCL
ncbi:putative feruloyl esterase B-1 [Aspergillus spectabilis]